MIKCNTLAFGMTAILIFGLVSCGSDKQRRTTDAYKAPIPRIVKGQQRQDLKAWDHAVRRDLDIQDAIDVEGSSAVSVQITAQCRSGAENLNRTETIENPKIISIYQILPNPLLIQDLALAETHCSWKLTLVNETGSKHIYDVAEARIVDERPGDVALDPRPGADRPRFPSNALDSLRLRSHAPAGAQATLQCRDFYTADLPATAVMKLADFDFAKLNFRPDRPVDILEVHPIQLCRVQINAGGFTHSLSSLFELEFKRRPLQVTSTTWSYRTEVRYDENNVPYGSIKNGKALTVATYTVSNPSRMDRRVRLPKPVPNVQILAQIEAGAPTPFHKIVRPYLHVNPLPNPGVIITDLGDSYEILLSPNTTFNLEVVFQGPSLTCASLRLPTPKGFILEFSGSIVLRDLGENGEADDVSLDLGPPLYANSVQALLNVSTVITVGTLCSW